MTDNEGRTKDEVVDNILRQKTYSPDSGLYNRTRDRLLKLPLNLLQDLDLILIFRVSESNELCREVDRILGK